MIKYVFLTTVFLCTCILDNIITSQEIQPTIGTFLPKRGLSNNKHNTQLYDNIFVAIVTNYNYPIIRS